MYKGTRSLVNSNFQIKYNNDNIGNPKITYMNALGKER